jgi:5-methylthioadenosine/S-adenosylhomocysteine deaminase
MQDIDSVISARWVIPVEPAGAVLNDHAIAVHHGRILAVLPAAEAASRYQAREQVRRDSHVLIPGLVNAHTHAAMSLLRGLADDLPLAQWLGEHIWPAETRLVNRGFVHDGTRLAIAEMLLGGTTCFGDMYFFPDTVGEVAAEVGMRAVLGMIVLEFPTAWASDAGEYFSRGLELHDRFRDHQLITTTFAPHAPYTVSDDSLRRIRRLADELEVPVHMHLHETSAEITDSLRDHAARPFARMAALGLITPALMAVHMTHLEADEIAALATAGASVIHCPSSNMKLASGTCPVAKLIAAGVNVGLGTDGAASNNRLDMFTEMRLAALLAKHASGDPRAVDAATALRMATLGGARALGLGEVTGSLEPGKWADLTCIDLAALGSQPVLHPLSQVVYAAERSQVSDVWVAGRAQVRDHQLVRMAAQPLTEMAADWVGRVMPPTAAEVNSDV